MSRINDVVSAMLGEKKSEKGDKKTKKTAKKRNRGDVVFPYESGKVTDNKDHFPINNPNQARNALARANQYDKSPEWYKGSLDQLIKAVTRAVHKKYPDIKISQKAKTKKSAEKKKKLAASTVVDDATKIITG